MLEKIISFFCRRWHQTRTTHSIQQILTKKYNLLGIELDSAINYVKHLSSKTIEEHVSLDMHKINTVFMPPTVTI